MTHLRQISFEHAKSIARDAAQKELAPYLPKETEKYLSDRHIEAEGCWFFFSNENIQIPSTQLGLPPFTAFAVTKDGTLSYVYDFRFNEQQMMDYIQLFSLHATGKLNEAKAALNEFFSKYPSK